MDPSQNLKPYWWTEHIAKFWLPSTFSHQHNPKLASTTIRKHPKEGVPRSAKLILKLLNVANKLLFKRSHSDTFRPPLLYLRAETPMTFLHPLSPCWPQTVFVFINASTCGSSCWHFNSLILVLNLPYPGRAAVRRLLEKFWVCSSFLLRSWNKCWSRVSFVVATWSISLPSNSSLLSSALDLVHSVRRFLLQKVRPVLWMDKYLEDNKSAEMLTSD